MTTIDAVQPRPLSPAPALPHADAPDRLPGLLSFVAGMVDVTGWLTLGGLFTAHITGNLVVIAANVVRGATQSPAQVLAVPMFVLAVVAADRITHRLHDGGPATLRTLLLLQAVLLVAACVLGGATSPSRQPHGVAACAVGMLAVSAMAVQNALLHLTRKAAPATAVMTGNLVVCTIALLELWRCDADSAEARRRWDATWPLLAGFVVGCGVGSGAVLALGNWAWGVPAALAVLTFLFHRASPHAASARDCLTPVRRRAASAAGSPPPAP